MNRIRHPYQSMCPLCSDEYQRNAQRRPIDADWRRADSIRGMCYILAAVSVALIGLVASVFVPGLP